MPIVRKNQVPADLWQSIKPNQSVRHFENAVIQFHYLHRTPIRHLPYVLGKKINLRKLYVSVIKRGGYKKVNEKEVWDDVLVDLNLPKEATNSELAIQSIYHRYLEDFERNQWNSLSNGDLTKHGAFISDLSVRDRSCLASFVNDNTPKTFSDYQHLVSNTVRSEAGLSCDLRQVAELTHLVMSLKSGLCNEIDFALNTLLLMSHNDRISLDLRFTGDLMELVVAAGGVVDQGPGCFYEQFKTCLWMHDSLRFWNKTIKDGSGRMFLIPNIFTCSKSDIKELQEECYDSVRNDVSELFNDDNQYHQIVDPCCQRIHLVATILHNLAIDSIANCQTIVSSNQTLRFLLLAVHSRDSVLRRLALHTLTKLRFVLCPIQDGSDTGQPKLNIFVNIDNVDDDSEQDWFTEFLLDFLMSLLASEDRRDRISAYEMLQTLCLIEDNQETLSRHLHNQYIIRITSQLLVPDIHPLCCALEALVALSQLGDDMCRRMASCKSLLKCLLQFVTIEAQMFGTSAIYKIKTFNSRPPIPVPNYHSLHMPVQNNFRAIAPFASPLGPMIPNTTHNQIRSPNMHSISQHSLSKPFLDPVFSPSPVNIVFSNNNTTQYINNQNIPQHKSQLSPLQQIDHLLTKSIASFSTPEPISIIAHQINDNDEITQQREKQNETDPLSVKGEKSDEKNVNDKQERRIVKIKCCVESDDLEIGDINGVNRADRNTVENGTVNGFISDELQLESKTELDNDEEKELSYVYQNGSLELDVSSDDDSDRRQMPPPSLPTPSMLKKQMRPKTSPQAAHINMTNGFLPLQQQQQPEHDERCEQAKAWLKKNFQITDDVKLFVTKQQLVEELNDALFDIEDSFESSVTEQKIVLSAQELHSCIKEIFGHKVQVKVEHGTNGNNQLIYSHLTRINVDKCAVNGVVTGDINGFINHSSKRKNSNYNIDKEVNEKKVCEDNDEEEINNDTTEASTKKRRNCRKKSYNLSKKLTEKYKLLKLKNATVCKSPRTLTRVTKTDSGNIAVCSDQLLTILPTTVLSKSIESLVPCLWAYCTQRFVDEGTLQAHLTKDHLTNTTWSAISSPTRAQCQWRDCTTSNILRAPLSLLSHVIQEHCVAPSPASLTSTSNPRAMSMSSSPGHPHSLNTMIPSNIRLSNATTQNNHHQQPLLEKCGWSVLYDHYRIDEQLSGNLPEGPITKHIRISSAIILRNMSRHSILAKEFLRSHERHLSVVALGSQDCASIIVQCLDELAPALSLPGPSLLPPPSQSSIIVTTTLIDEDDDS